MKKLHKVSLGKFYDFNLFVEVPEFAVKDIVQKFENHKEWIKTNVVEEYKSNQFLHKMETKIKHDRENESFAFKLYQKIMQ